MKKYRRKNSCQIVAKVATPGGKASRSTCQAGISQPAALVAMNTINAPEIAKARFWTTTAP